MEREFNSRDVKNTVDSHRVLIRKLEYAVSKKSKYIDDIQTAASLLINNETIRILREMPVDELNRDKKGIRIKAIKDAGYNTVADIVASSTWSLSSINGISDNTAYIVKNYANEIADITRKGVKIRLSADNRDTKSTELVMALARFRKSQPFFDKIEWILNSTRMHITNAINDVAVAQNSIKWFFCSKPKKEEAKKAYDMLYTMLNNQYVQDVDFNTSNVQIISNISSEEAWEDFSSNSIEYFNILEKIAPNVLGKSNSTYGLPENLAKQIQEECFFPDGLLCELRKYQEWGVKYILHQERVLLGDEMGLGKTVQAIATMVSLRNTGATHFVVVCPASVLTNWCREIREKSKLNVIKVHGADRLSALTSWIKLGGVAVTTYETTKFFELANDFRFDFLVVDEAHYIKNDQAQRSKNVINLCSHTNRLLFMTGTAIENNVDEMVSLIRILQPNVSKEVESLKFLSRAPEFREKISPVYYRRKREDVLSELPELLEFEEWCTLLPLEEQIYEESILSKSYSDARRVSWNVDDLRNSSKARRLEEIAEEAKSEGRKIIVFSFFLDTIKKVTTLFADRCLPPINGSVSPNKRQEIIDQFEKAPNGAVLAAQIQSGGTGLNIQSASVVVICEPQFKPSIENQAISRAYRMGQSRNVLVYRLLCENTVEEHIFNKLKEKQAIFDAFADESVAAAESLKIDENTFKDIINEEIERINKKRNVNESVDK